METCFYGELAEGLPSVQPLPGDCQALAESLPNWGRGVEFTGLLF